MTDTTTTARTNTAVPAETASPTASTASAASAPPEAGTHTARHTRRRWILLAAGAIVLAAAAAIYWHLSGWESTDDAQIDGFIYPVSSRITGQVTEVLVEDNQYVKAGTVLVRLDTRDYQVALASARAALANTDASATAQRTNVPITSTDTASQLSTAQADIENARAGLASAERQHEAALASLRQAEANDLKAQDDVSRYKPLAQRDEIPQRQYTQALDAQRGTAAAVDAARASAAAAEQTIAQARARLAQAGAGLQAAQTRPNQIAVQRARAEAAQADSERARAALAQAELNLRYITIIAPVSGIVGQRSVYPGQNVSPGQQLLTVVPIDSENLWVTANFKETQLMHMRPAQLATIVVDAYGRTYTGRVLNIAGASGSRYSLLPPENATGNYVKVVQRIPVKIVFDPGQDTSPLRLGMSVEPAVRIR